MKNKLKIDRVQKILYVIGLAILIIVSFKDGTGMLNQQSSLGISYWYFLIIPGVILLYQSIFNNQYGWYSLVSLYSFYFIWTIISIISGVKEKTGYFVVADYVTLTVIILVLLLFGFFLYLIKPIKK